MPRRRSRAFSLTLAAASVPLALSLSAHAASPSWASSTSGRWLTAASWSTGTTPAPGDTVTIDAPGSYTVTLDGYTNVGPVTLNAPAATLSILNSTGSFYTGAFAVSAGTLAVQSRLSSLIHINALSFSNAGTITFDTDLESGTSGTVFADINTNSGNVTNSGTIEAHTAPFVSPTQPHYPPVYSFTGVTGKTFTNTGTLRAAPSSSLLLSNYTLNQNAGSLDGAVEVDNGTLNYNGGSCSPTTSVLLSRSTLKIAPAATAGNFLFNSGTLNGNIPAGNTVQTWYNASLNWTGTGSTFTNAGRLVIGEYSTVSSNTTTGPSLSLGSSSYTLLNTGTLELNSPAIPATTVTGSITNQGTVTVHAANTTYANVPTGITGSFTQNAGGSLTIDPSTSLSVSAPNWYSTVDFYFNGGTISGSVLLNNATTHFAPGLANTGGGTFTFSSTASPPAAPTKPFTGDIPSGATFVYVVNSSSTTASTFFSFNNAGALRTSNSTGYRAVFNILDYSHYPYSYPGTLTNTGSLGGTVNGVDRGIDLQIDGNLTNTGDIKAYNLSVSKGTFNQNAGTLYVDNVCTVSSGATFNYNGGTLAGKPISLLASTLNIAAGTGPASFTFFSGSCTLHGSPALGSALALDTIAPYSGVIVSLTADPFTNAGTLSFAATTVATTSTLTVTGSGALTNTGTLSVTQGNGGTRTLNANVTNTGTFSIGPGATLTLTGSLTTSTPLDLQGTLDLRGPLTWSNPATPSPADAIRSYLLNRQLTDSLSDPTHRLAYAQSFSGEPTAPTSVLVQLALTGDTNLDGRLDPDDYTLLDRSLARNLADAHWTDGDFNYDGLIDQQDYLAIDTTYLQQQGGIPSPSFLSQRESQFGDAYVSQLLASVPEPSSLLAACGLAFPLTAARRPARSRTRAKR